ncbi:MAG: class I SAM-dependent methyltransferase [Acidimicrobiia bacterium]|nr:class I SAM-dependent methyltransferase [Acidimicrobiia bacterium]
MASQHRAAAAYDTVAAEYDLRFCDELDGKPRDRELLDGLAARASGVVLDVGSGPGHIGARIRASGRPVVAVDVSLAMADAAARRVDAALVADTVHIPVRAATISDIVAFYSIIHLPRLRLGDALREFARVLVPGGHVLLSAHEGTEDVAVTEFLGHQVDLSATFFTLDELVAAAVDAGLTVTLAERRAPYATEGSTNRLYVELENQ